MSSRRAIIAEVEGPLYEVRILNNLVLNRTAYYVIEVQLHHRNSSTGTPPWILIRRFSELLVEHKKLLSQPGLGLFHLLPFPSSSYSVFRLDPAYLARRQLHLERYLQRLADASLRNSCCRASLGRMLDSANLHRFAVHNDIESVRFVVSQSLSGVDAVDRVGATALHQACARGHDQLVRQLLQFGADPNLRDLSHFTPLQLARGKGHTEIVQMLRQAGADDNDDDDCRQTGMFRCPLHYRLTPSERRHLLLCNPASGKGHASTILAEQVLPIMQAASLNIAGVIETTHEGHAEKIAREIDLYSFDVLVVISGDGVLFEFLNGIALRDPTLESLSRISVSVVPAGSGNALACSLGINSPIEACIRLTTGVFRPVDLFQCRIPSASLRKIGFVFTSWGLISDADIDSNYLRWMGDIRFSLEAVRIVLSRRRYQCRVSFLPADVPDPECQMSLLNRSNPPQKRRRWSVPNTWRTKVGASHTQQQQQQQQKQPPTRVGADALSLGSQVQTPSASSWVSVEGDFSIVLGCSLPKLSNDFTAAPDCGVNDRLLHLVLVPHLSVLKSLRILSELESGKYCSDAQVQVHKVRQFSIEPLCNFSRIDTDGEPLVNAVAHVSTLKNELMVSV